MQRLEIANTKHLDPSRVLQNEAILWLMYKRWVLKTSSLGLKYAQHVHCWPVILLEPNGRARPYRRNDKYSTGIDEVVVSQRISCPSIFGNQEKNFYVPHRGSNASLYLSMYHIEGRKLPDLCMALWWLSWSLITTQDDAGLSGCWPRQIFGYSSLLCTTDTFVSLLKLHKEGSGMGHLTDWEVFLPPLQNES